MINQTVFRHSKKKKFRKTALPIIMLLIFIIPALAGIGIAFYLYTHPLVLKNPIIEQEVNTPFHPSENIDRVYFGEKEDVKIDSQADPEKIGDYTVTYTLREYQCTAEVRVRDTTPPVLKVRPYATDLAEHLTPELFVEKTSDAGEVTVSFTDGEPPSKEGTFNVSVTATDTSGNQTTQTAVLTRTKDTTPPVLTGLDDVEIMQGNSFDFNNNITVSDDMDPAPDYSVSSEQVNFTVPGTYHVIYTVSDRSGNSAELERKVTVKSLPDNQRKIVYLTFDDGPSKNTEKILDILKQYNAKGTFFVTGMNPGYNYTLQRIVNEGSAIGLHTYTHNYAQIYASEDAYFSDLKKISDMVEQAAGIRSNILRFPGGSSNTVSKQYSPGLMTKLTSEVQKRGYRYFDWNCDSTDASGNNVPIKTIVEKATSCSSRHINILMHDTASKNTTVEALPEIIKYYRNHGYSFETLTADSLPVHHTLNN